MSGVRTLACDLAVVGAGAAGLASALRAASLGLDVVVATRGAAGGRLQAAERIPVVNGLPVGLSGEELVARAVSQAERAGVRVLERTPVVSLEGPVGRRHRLKLAGGAALETRAVVLACGVDRSLTTVDGADRLLGAGVHTREPATAFATGGHGPAYITGEPETAARAALVLSALGARATIVAPTGGVARTLPADLRRELQRRSSLDILPWTEVIAVDGVERVEVVVLRNVRSGRLRVQPASSLWLAGVEGGRTGWLPGSLERDVAGLLRTGRVPGRLPSETSRRGVFAAGDCRAGAPCGRGSFEEGIDAAEQAYARLRLDLDEAA